jgi:hypothetical protein
VGRKEKKGVQKRGKDSTWVEAGDASARRRGAMLRRPIGTIVRSGG